MQGLGRLYVHQALAGSHRARTFAPLQPLRGTLGRSFGPCWCFVIPARHGGCPGQLHSWVPAAPHSKCGLGAQAWSHTGVPKAPDQHRTQGHEMHQLRGLWGSALLCGLGRPTDYPCVPCSGGSGGDSSTALLMGATRQTFFRSWMHFWHHCWAAVKSDFLIPVIIHQQHLTKQ